MSSPKEGSLVKRIPDLFNKIPKPVLAVVAAGAGAAALYFAYKYWNAGDSPSDSGVVELKPFLVKDEAPKKVTLLQKIVQNQDSFIFRFALPDGYLLGVPTGYHLYIHLPNESGEIKAKPYTPISLPTQQKHFDLLVKVYKPDPERKVGNHTPQLEALNVGDEITISGPIGKHEYKGNGVFGLPTADGAREDKTFSHISFVAGGSGITPFLSILNKVKSLKNDNTLLTLIYSNKTETDILCQRELEEATKQVKFKAVFTVTRQNEVSSDKIHKGRVTADFLKAHLPAAAADHLVFHCGPAGFNTAVSEQLKELGHTALKF